MSKKMQTKKYKRALNKKQYRCLLGDLCSEYCEKDKWCLLKEILVSLHPDPRLLVQLKCVEKFKYEISKEENKEIGWSEALAKWIDEGYAEKFSGIYEEDKNFRAIYNEVMKEES